MNDSELQCNALQMWANYIETGAVTTSAKDAKNAGREIDIRALNENQMMLVLRLRGLAARQLATHALDAPPRQGVGDFGRSRP